MLFRSKLSASLLSSLSTLCSMNYVLQEVIMFAPLSKKEARRTRLKGLKGPEGGAGAPLFIN